MHFHPILSSDSREYLRQLSDTAATNHERRERARQDALRRIKRRAPHTSTGCVEPTSRPATAT